MQKRPILIIACSLLAMSTYAQSIDFNHFSTLQSAGKVPDDFTVRTSEKVNQDKSQIESDNKREQKDKETFLIESNYALEEMLNSGRVVFGDPISIYLNGIKDEILKNDPKLRNEIRIYTLLTNDVNAFTFDNGIVVVTTGLVSQVQDESQLAYILCHEFIHFTEKHAITSFVENKKIERGTGVYGSLRGDDETIAKFSYAKEQETEADEKGLELFEKTNYSTESIAGVFDVLLYSYLPIDEVPFDRTYFNSDMYILPNTIFSDTLNEITAEEDYDDTESSHPNIGKRKEDILGRLPMVPDQSKHAFIQDKSKFDYAQKIARFQGCELFLIDIQYEDALYQAYILSKADTANLYLKHVIAQSLYGLAMYKNAHATPDWHTYYKKVEGESQQVYYMMNKINSKELNVLALKYAWDLHKSNPADNEMELICKQLGAELRNTHDINYSEFMSSNQTAAYKAAQQAKTDSTLAVAPEDTTGTSKSSKYDKIKKGKTTVDANTSYWKFAFENYTNDSEFKDLFVKKEEETATKSSRKKKKEQFRLGVDEIVMVDPVYLRVDERDKVPVQYEAAEVARAKLNDMVHTDAEKLDLKVDYLDHYNVKENNVEDFNDIAVLNRWIHEKLDHLDEDVPMITSTNDDLQALAKKYGTDYFTWVGIVSFTERESNVGAKIVLCIYVPLAPFLIYDLVTPDRTTYYFALVANAKTGKFEMQYFNSNSLQASTGVTNSNLYYILQQIKADPK